MNPQNPVGPRPPSFESPNSGTHTAQPAQNPAGWPCGAPVQQAAPQPPYPYPYAMPAGFAPPAAPSFPLPAAPAIPKIPYGVTRADGFLAVGALVLGFLFMRWGAFNNFEGWGVAVVTGLWLLVLLWYAAARGMRPGLAGLFWVAVTALTGLSCALWPGAPWHPLRGLLLLFAALYGAAVVLRVLLRDKTGNLFFFDGINLLFVLPFRNLGYLFAGLGALPGEKGQRGQRAKKLLPALAGLLIGAILLAIVVPMLARADTGNFGRLLNDFSRWLRGLDLFEAGEAARTTVQLLAGVPLAVWLCGLLAGAAHGRYSKSLTAGGVERGLASLRFLPGSTILVVLALVSAAYALFIGCQIPYFFSALGGAAPEGYEIYSEYAREGFFELCRIAAINLGLMAVAGGLYRGSARASKALKALNVLLSAFTLLIIFTACSKMGLYISVYGLTPLRVLTCVFMAFLAGVCVGVILLQFFRFSIVRVSLALGAVLLCALCLVDTGGLIVRYNANRYLAGTLAEFDEGVLYHCGPSGAEAAMEVYNSMDFTGDPRDEPDAHARLRYVLDTQIDQAEASAGTAADTLALARVRSLDMPRLPYYTSSGSQLFWEKQRGYW